MNNQLQELFQAYKNRPNKGCKHNSSAYINYAEAVQTINPKLDITEFKTGNKIHYMTGTIIGSFMYNAKVITVDDSTITIQPCGTSWKNKYLKFENNSNTYIAKGWL